VTLSDPRVEQTGLRRYYLVPSASTAPPGESPALDVLAQLMGNGANSYLYRALVIDKQLAVSAGAGYHGTALDATQFMISVSPKPGVEFPQVEQAIDQVISDVGQNPIRPEDLERVKTPTDRRGDLRPGQPGDAGALVRRRAHFRPEHRRHQELAGSYSRRHRRAGARRGTKMAR
jgi:hypothetical protein